MDIIYREGQQIQPNCSTHCTCINGEFECENVLCSVDGATCVASGLSHYQTFDLQFFDFQGDCKYVLTTPCDSNEFIITVQNIAHNQFVSCTDQVNITTTNTEIILGRGDYVIINGEDMMQTYDSVVTATSEVQVLRVGGNSHVILLTHNIRIFWDGLYRVEVTVSTTWQNKLCGLLYVVTTMVAILMTWLCQMVHLSLILMILPPVGPLVTCLIVVHLHQHHFVWE